MMTAKEVAEYTQLNLRTIYRMKDRGELPYYRAGNRVRFKKCEVDKALRGGEKNAKKDGTRRHNDNPVSS